MTNMCHIIYNVNMQLRKPMFCDNAEEHGKAWGDNSETLLEI